MDELLESIEDIPEPTEAERKIAQELVTLVRDYNHEPDELLVSRVAEVLASDKRGYISRDNFTLSRYQYLSRNTAVYPNIGKNYIYPTLGLVNEAGEVAGKIKKVQRDDGGIITEVTRDLLEGEIGDVLWYIANLSSELGFDLGEVAMRNLAKLRSRKKRGKLKGSGDKR